jgi:hypothetical protein
MEKEIKEGVDLSTRIETCTINMFESGKKDDTNDFDLIHLNECIHTSTTWING